MKVLLDMDGVIVDFHRGVSDWFNIDLKAHYDGPKPMAYDYLGISEAKFWERVDDTFWEQLHWTSDGEEILSRVIDKFGLRNVCVASDPGPKPSGYAGKRKWLDQHLPGVQSMLGSCKHFLAHSGSLLIDDYDRNVIEFIEHGGNAILIPRPWNRYHDFNTLEYVRRVL